MVFWRAMSPSPAVRIVVRSPSRTRRIVPGAPAATSASRSCWRADARLAFAVGVLAGADAATRATAARQPRIARGDVSWIMVVLLFLAGAVSRFGAAAPARLLSACG